MPDESPPTVEAIRNILTPADAQAIMGANNRLREALKACWAARHDPAEIERLVFDAITPTAPLTDEDLAWAEDIVTHHGG